MTWLGLAAGLLGLLWIGTSFGGGGQAGPGGHLQGRDPRAWGPAIWVQRAMGAALLVVGVLLGLHRL